MIWDETVITVRFNEVDAYQVAWHGHYVSWMETGRTSLARRFGLDPFQLSELGYLGPVVQLDLKYLRPARYNDRIVVRTTLEVSETATLVFISEIAGNNGEMLAKGRTVHALTDIGGVLQFQIPGVLEERINEMRRWAGGEPG